jgi:aminomethyltransferase
MDMGKQFTGRDAVAREIERGPAQTLAGLILPGRQSARHGQRVLADGPVGEITSGSFAPSLGYAVAFAYLDASAAAPGTRLTVDTGRKTLDATVGTLPFYTAGTARG